jgi:predicted O-methyltransferase YrrM
VVAALLLGGVNAAGAGEERAREAARREFLAKFPRTPICTTPEDAMLLRILVETRKAQRGVEVGSALGYGAIHMGLGFERTGGQLITVDIDPEMVRKCRANLEAVGLSKSVTVVEGDALEVLPKLEGEFDFVFLDAVKEDTLKYLQALEKKLKPGAVVVADNTIRSAAAMRDFLDYLRTSPDYLMATVRASDEKRDGMTVAYRLR